jgi:ribosomal protein L37AE/L43A
MFDMGYWNLKMRNAMQRVSEIRCPNCQSDEVARLGPDMAECDNCGHQWEFEEEQEQREKPEGFHCPDCYSQNLYHDDAHQGNWVCEDCGNRWKPTHEEKGYERMDHPGPLYHMTSPQNRELIQQEGLHPRTEGVFLTTDPSAWEYALGPQTQNDVWSVDTRGLPLYPDLEGGSSGVDYVHAENIPPKRLTLYQPGTLT